MLNILLPVLLIVIIIYAFDTEAYRGANLGYFAILLLQFGTQPSPRHPAVPIVGQLATPPA